MITRRSALKGLGAAGAALVSPRLLAGCGGGSDPGPGGPKGITTIVSICMENRSYDHYLGARSLLEGKPGDGLRAGMTNPDGAGDPVEIFHASVADAAAVCVPDPPHSWGASRSQFNGGENDGFLQQYQLRHGDSVEPHVLSYLTRADLPVTWALADAYTSCDRWFSSVMGPTWPNRLYLHAAQSGGRRNNDVPPGGVFPLQTIYHRLNAAQVPWACYYTDVTIVSMFGKDLEVADNIRPLEFDFFDDAAAGRLPPVVVIEPGFATNDDHPPKHPLLGQHFLHRVYSALAASPQWENLLLVITYDEHGGFFDHVPPPKAADDRAAEGFDQLGFRVPTLIVGPYVKKGHVSSVVHDHTSLLKHIETRFGLAPLTARDAAANDLSDAIDLARLEAGQPEAPISLPELGDEREVQQACTG